MPMRSQAQRGFLWANHPEIAKRFEAETPKGADLPEHVKKKRRMSDREQSAHMNRLIRGR